MILLGGLYSTSM